MQRRLAAVLFAIMAVVVGWGSLTAGPLGTRRATLNAQVAPSPAATSAYFAAVLSNSPVAYYHLDDPDGIAFDSSGNAYNLTIGSGVTRQVPGLLASSADTAVGLPGTAGSLNNIVGTFARGPTSVEPTGAISVEAWVRLTSIPSVQVPLVVYGNPTPYTPYAMGITAAAHVYFALALPTPTGITGTKTLATGTIYHVVATYNGSTAMSIYVNGALDITSAATGAIGNYAVSGACGLTIGSVCTYAGGSPQGTVDEVAIYGTALSPSAIATHYALGGPTPAPAPVLANYGSSKITCTGANSPFAVALANPAAQPAAGTLLTIVTKSNDGAGLVGVPAGFARVGVEGGNLINADVFTKFATGSEGFSFSVPSTCTAGTVWSWVFAVTGANATTPYDSVTINASTLLTAGPFVTSVVTPTILKDLPIAVLDTGTAGQTILSFSPGTLTSLGTTSGTDTDTAFYDVPIAALNPYSASMTTTTATTYGHQAEVLALVAPPGAVPTPTPLVGVHMLDATGCQDFPANDQFNVPLDNSTGLGTATVNPNNATYMGYAHANVGPTGTLGINNGLMYSWAFLTSPLPSITHVSSTSGHITNPPTPDYAGLGGVPLPSYAASLFNTGDHNLILVTNGTPCVDYEGNSLNVSGTYPSLSANAYSVGDTNMNAAMADVTCTGEQGLCGSQAESNLTSYETHQNDACITAGYTAAQCIAHGMFNPILHVLHAETPYNTGTGPSFNCDGSSSNGLCIPVGGRLQLLPQYVTSTDPNGYAVQKAMNQFGITVDDNGGSWLIYMMNDYNHPLTVPSAVVSAVTSLQLQDFQVVCYQNIVTPGGADVGWRGGSFANSGQYPFACN